MQCTRTNRDRRERASTAESRLRHSKRFHLREIPDIARDTTEIPRDPWRVILLRLRGGKGESESANGKETEGGGKGEKNSERKKNKREGEQEKKKEKNSNSNSEREREREERYLHDFDA